MKFITALSIAVLLLGCNTIKNSVTPKAMAFKKNWVRSSLQKEYYGPRVIHRFEPIAYEDLIIVGNGIDGIKAYTKNYGRVEWQLPLTNGVESGAQIDSEGILYFASNDGYFYAVKAVNGQVLWKFPIRSEGVGKPAISGKTVVFIAGNGIAYALNTANGELIWPYKRPDSTVLSIRGASEPLIYNNTVYLGFEDGYLVALELNTGKEKWQKKLNDNRRFNDIDSRPVLDGDKIYVSSFDGSLYCLNANSGDTLWKVDEGGYSPVTVSQNAIFYSSTTGQVLSLEKSSGHVNWRFKVSSGIATEPKLYKGLVIFGETEGHLYAVNALTGEVVSKFSPGRGVTSSIFIDEDKLYFLSLDANLFSLSLERAQKIGILN